jgi:hypothetical protein
VNGLANTSHTNLNGLVLEQRYIAELLKCMVEDGLQVRQQIVDDISNSVSRSFE